jgi:hypothetical protein
MHSMVCSSRGRHDDASLTLVSRVCLPAVLPLRRMTDAFWLWMIDRGATIERSLVGSDDVGFFSGMVVKVLIT